MLSLINVTLARGAKVLISNISLTVFPKQTIGIVGSNGCGKSTLFAALRGEVDTGGGEIQIPKNCRVAAIEQEVPGLEMNPIEFTLSGDKKLSQVFTDLAQAEREEDFEKVMHCHTQLHDLDGYSAEARAAKILVGLGFSHEKLSAPIKTFSGGWRMRLNLAKCLFAPSDLLLLDEPTNHLDMEAIIWLENFLKYYSGAILMVSHDQDFLDNTVTHIAHIENQQLNFYTGNFSTFEVLRAQAIAMHNAQFRKQQMQLDHMKKYVERFRYKASKARQAQSRLKAIERMEMIKPIYEKSPFQFKFLEPSKMPNPMLTLRKVNLGYGDHTILKNVNFSLTAGARLGLLGINGAGKSTFIKGLVGELPAQSGVIERSSNLVMGYFAQHQVDTLPADDCALVLLRRLGKPGSEKDLTTYLGGFGFSRDQSLAPLKNFSGGEKSRVALAMIIWQRPNLLLLDEPTNHLDMEMRQALSFALQTYEGAMVLVSHDRHLLRTLVDELYLIDNGKVELFDGSVEDYQILYS